MMQNAIVNNPSVDRSLCLRIEQVEHVDLATWAILQGRHAAIVAPTGSGKGCEQSALVARLISLERKVIVCSPRLDINSSIRSNFSTYDRVIFGPDSIELSSDMAREVNTDRLREYLHRPKSSNERWAPVICHQTMVRMGDFLPLDCSGIVLVIDECHHMGAKAQKKFLDEFTRRGGLTIGLTATPYRTDGGSVIFPDSVVAHLSVCDHMRSGNAPSRAISEIIACPTPRRVTEKAYLGKEVFDEQAAAIAKEMVKKYLRDGRPKVIAYCPPSGPSVSANRNLRDAIIHEFRAVDARVLNATGYSETNLNQILDKERTLPHSESEYDVIVGSARVQEGFDWPHCSSIYCVGMPKSTVLLVQLFGRTFRKKGRPIDGESNPYFPESYSDISEISFFIPTSNQGDDLKHLAKVHSWNTLALCTFLADHETGQRYVVMKAIRDGIRSACSSKKILPISSESRKGEIFETESDIAKVCIGLEMPTVESVDRNNRMLTEFQILETKSPGQVTNQALFNTLASKGFTPEEADTFLATKLVDSNPTACKNFQDRVNSNVVRGLSVEESVLDAFKNVLLQFRDETVNKVLLETVGRHVISVTGEEMADFSKRLCGQKFISYNDIQEICFENGLDSAPKYWSFRKRNPHLMLPAHPSVTCKKEWISWPHLFGTQKDRCIFSEARAICSKFNVRSNISYKKLRSEKPELCLPSNPSVTYKKDWISWPHFLSKPTGKFLPFLEAQKICVEAGLTSSKSYDKFRKGNPQHRLPSDPEIFYSEWTTWSDFHQTKPISFSDARKICSEATIRSENEFLIFRKNNPQYNLPSNPSRTYKDEWISWPDFLGKNHRYDYISYPEARKICIENNIRTIDQYHFFRSMNPSCGLPSAPRSKYGEWVSWRHLFGKSSSRRHEFVSFDEAHEICMASRIKTGPEYEIFRKANPSFCLPSNPYKFYLEWISWDHFLGRVSS